MYGGGDSAMGLFPLSAAFLSAGGIGTRGKPLETVGRKARGWGAGKRITLVRLQFGKPSETAGRQSQRLRRICAMLVRLPNSLRPKMGKEGKTYL